MREDAETRYRILLKINNALATRKSLQALFNAISQELHKHFNYDRLSAIPRISLDKPSHGSGYIAETATPDSDMKNIVLPLISVTLNRPEKLKAVAG